MKLFGKGHKVNLFGWDPILRSGGSSRKATLVFAGALVVIVLAMSSARAFQPIIDDDPVAEEPRSEAIHDSGNKAQLEIKSNTDSSTAGPTTNEQTGEISNQSTTSVTVNGQSIPVPENGSVHKTIPNDSGNGTTEISIENNQSSTGNNTRSSTHVNIHSHSSNSNNTNNINDSCSSHNISRTSPNRPTEHIMVHNC